MPPALRSAARPALAALIQPQVVALAAASTLTASVVVAAVDVAQHRSGQVFDVVAAAPSTESTAAPTPPDAQPLGRGVPPAGVRPLEQRLRPDVLVRLQAPLTSEQAAQIAALGRAVLFRSGTVRVGGQAVGLVAVDPSTFRAFAPEGTAEENGVWETVARGELVASHRFGSTAGLQLGAPVDVTPAPGGKPASLRLGALATTGIPGADLVVDDATGQHLGLVPWSGVLLTAPEGKDSVALADAVRAVVGDNARVDLLTQPVENPVAFLSGSKAAKAFGAFSYRYYPDGTIEPDPAWVRANIVTTTVPVLGRVTCHRLMIPQMRAALQEIQDSGLAHLIRTFDGCYVPRFIARNPDNSISLHTWGIAFDIDAATNYRGIRGTMDDRIVAIFKKWGFRWGGDWSYTDPMHFELGALMTVKK